MLALRRSPASGHAAAAPETRDAAEVPAHSLGLDPQGLEGIWQAVRRLHATGLHPALALAVRWRGALVLNRSIGRLDDSPGAQAASIHTPFCLFSASKAISSLLIHKLVDEGALTLDDRVAAFIPRFAAQGKHRVTLRDLLAHRAGIPTFVVDGEGPDLLYHWDELIERLCAAQPFDPRFHAQAYHALTAGFLVGEVVRRVSGMVLPEALDRWITRPLGLEQMSFGLPPERRAAAARNRATGFRPVWPLTAYIRAIIGMDFVEGVEATNEPAFLSTVVPAGNLFATAEETCRIFQMLLDRGEWQGQRLLSAPTLDAAVRAYGPRQMDRTLRLPLRFSPGFMLGESPFGLFGPAAPRAFGHLGFTTVLAWADPDRQLAVALLNNGKTLSPRALYRTGQLLTALNRTFSPA